MTDDAATPAAQAEPEKVSDPAVKQSAAAPQEAEGEPVQAGNEVVQESVQSAAPIAEAGVATESSSAQDVVSPVSPLPQPAAPQPVSTATQGAVSMVNELLTKARATIQTRKRKKLARIMEFVAEHDSITNDDVEKMLHVSDATATNYLDILVREGRLKRIGTTGKAVRYEKT